MANAVQAAITGQQDIPPQSAYEPEQATAAFEPQGSSYADDDEDAEAERVRRYAPKGRLFDDDEDDDEGTQMYDTDDLDYDDDDDGYDKKSKNVAATPMTTKPVRTTSWPSASSTWPRPSRPLSAP